jgi:acyl dehydratase
MALDPSAVGSTTEPLTLTYDWRDTVLYALGVGARGATELDYLYEGRGPKVLPTFAVVPTFPAMKAALPLVGGDFKGVVHASQRLTVHRPFPPAGTLRTVGEVAGVHDLKRMATATFRTRTEDADGALLCEAEFGLIYRFDGGFGGTPPPRGDKVQPPAREPDLAVDVPTHEDQALLYRLSGDENPLHADPELAQEVGFDRPILHGLCTYGVVGRVVLQELGGGDPSVLRGLHGRFQKPVFPGDLLTVRGWREDGGRVILQVLVRERDDEVVFGQAYAELV